MFLDNFLESNKWHNTTNPKSDISSAMSYDTGESELSTLSLATTFASSMPVLFGDKLKYLCLTLVDNCSD